MKVSASSEENENTSEPKPAGAKIDSFFSPFHLITTFSLYELLISNNTEIPIRAYFVSLCLLTFRFLFNAEAQRALFLSQANRMHEVTEKNKRR